MTTASRPRRTPLKRFFLWRRAIDPILLMLAAMIILLPANLAVWLFGIFMGIGVYLIFGRHRSMRRIDLRYAAAAAILAVGSLAISLANGGLPEDFRWATYPVYYFAVVPLSVGVVLVRDPVRQLVIGARAGLVIVTAWSIYAVAAGEYRYGFGSNPANAAFAIAFIAVVSRIKVSDAPRWLSSERFFFYLAIIPVLVTGTRATALVFVAAAILDLLALARLQHRQVQFGSRRVLASVAAGVIALSSIGWMVAPTVTMRASATIEEVDNLLTDPTAAVGGLSLRLALLRNAVEVISENPVLGVGGSRVESELQGRIPAELRPSFEGLSFSHNVILDEAMQRGLLGVALLVGFYVYTVARIARHASADIRQNLALAMLLILSFGMLHHLLLVDRHVAMIAVYFVLLITENHLRRLRERRRSPLAGTR